MGMLNPGIGMMGGPFGQGSVSRQRAMQRDEEERLLELLMRQQQQEQMAQQLQGPVGPLRNPMQQMAEQLFRQNLQDQEGAEGQRLAQAMQMLQQAGGQSGGMVSGALQGADVSGISGPLPQQYGQTNAAIGNIINRIRGQQGQGPFAATDEGLDAIIAASQRQQMLNSLTPSQRRMLSPVGRPQGGMDEQGLRQMLLRARAEEAMMPENQMLAREIGMDPGRIGAMAPGTPYSARSTNLPAGQGPGLMGNRVVPRETREQKGLENLTRRYRQKVRMLGRTLGLSEGFNPDAANREELKGELERLRGARVQRNLTRIGKQREEEAFQQRRAQQQTQRNRFLQSLPLPLRVKVQQQMAENDLARRQLEGEAEDRDIKRVGQEQAGAHQKGVLELNRDKLEQEGRAAERQAGLDERSVDIEQQKADTQRDLLAWDRVTKTKEFEQAKAEFETKMGFEERKQKHEESMAAQALGFQELQLGNPRFESMRQELNARITLSNRIIKTAQFVRDNPSITEAQKQIMFADAAKYFQDEWENVEGAPDWSASDIETAVNKYLIGEFDQERLEAAFGDDIGFFGDFWRNTLNWIPGVPDYLYDTPAVEDI